MCLPKDQRGFPVPWFVAWVNGDPDFRMIDTPKLPLAVKRSLCWICGMVKSYRHHTFVIGPMCAINRVTSEPPCHYECAEFAIKACPFLTQPRMRRNEKSMPEKYQEAVGTHLDHNPGVTCLWTTREFRPFQVDGGVLFRLGKSENVSWFREGRAATRLEVEAAIEKGLPKLKELAASDGQEGLKELEHCHNEAKKLLPI